MAPVASATESESEMSDWDESDESSRSRLSSLPIPTTSDEFEDSVDGSTPVIRRRKTLVSNDVLFSSVGDHRILDSGSEDGMDFGWVSSKQERSQQHYFANNRKS